MKWLMGLSGERITSRDEGSRMKNALRVLVWLLSMLGRGLLIAAGWVIVPFTLIGDGADRTPRIFRWFGDAIDVPASHSKSRWTKYVWMAWRNPVEGLDGTLTQPIPEKHPNPDYLVRGYWSNGAKIVQQSASRWMEHGIFWEYWYLRRISIGKYQWFEFRVGWKFVDGNDDFVPTFQLGPRSS
jgi:hypothetical protein